MRRLRRRRTKEVGAESIALWRKEFMVYVHLTANGMIPHCFGSSKTSKTFVSGDAPLQSEESGSVREKMFRSRFIWVAQPGTKTILTVDVVTKAVGI